MFCNSYTLKDVPLVEFMYPVFNRTLDERNCRWFRALLLCSLDVFQALFNCLCFIWWFNSYFNDFKTTALKTSAGGVGGGSAKALPQKQTYCEKQLKYTVQNGPVKNSKSKKQKPCYIITQLLQSHHPGWLGVKTKYILIPPKLADLQFYKQ